VSHFKIISRKDATEQSRTQGFSLRLNYFAPLRETKEFI